MSKYFPVEGAAVSSLLLSYMETGEIGGVIIHTQVSDNEEDANQLNCKVET